jgi:hypothetical protein
MRAEYPIHLILSNLIILVTFSEGFKLLSSSSGSFSSRLPYHPHSIQISSSAPCSKISFSLNVRYQASHSYKTTGKIIVVCV